MKHTQLNTNDILNSSIEELTAQFPSTLVPHSEAAQATKEAQTVEAGVLGARYWVESFGCTLLPPTADKQEAEKCYLHSSSREKALRRLVGGMLENIETNAPYRYPKTRRNTQPQQQKEL